MKFEDKRSGIGTGAVAAAVIVVILIAGAAYFIFVPGSSTSSTTTTSTTSTTTSLSTTSTTSTTSSSSCAMSSVSGTIIIPQGAGSGSNFCPSSATIVIGVNNTVTWMDQDTVAPHNIYFTSIPTGASQPTTSPTLMSGDSFNVTLTTPGTYKYECQFHPGWMQGTLTVIAGTGTTTTTSTTTSSTSSTTTSSTSSATTSSSTTSSGPTATVIIPQGAGSGSNFSPATITISSGTTITFVDQDSIAPHNVWFLSIPTGATNPNTAANQTTGWTLLKGQSTSYTLTTPGTYTYECQFHSTWMMGTITVTA